jgi:uncharacterized protein YqeY
MDLLESRIRDDMKAAMKAKDKERLNVIRMMLAAIQQIEVDERIELDDARTIVVLDKMLKPRRDSIKQFNAANRLDLSKIEEAEILVIQDFYLKQYGKTKLKLWSPRLYRIPTLILLKIWAK